MNPSRRLHDLGQSIWLDNITHDLLGSTRWQRPWNAAARPQRLLWASGETRQ
jgi:hypothetical protein